MAKKIPLTKGKFAIVDNEDYERVSQHKWHFSGRYAVRKVNGVNEMMHRIINNAPAGQYTDHIDGNGLNNVRKNLRNCSQSQNIANRGKQSNNQSGYKGVSLQRHISKRGDEYLYWYAQIQIKTETKKRKVYGKNFPFTDDGKLQAARWYDEQARLHFGEFAKVNGV